MTVTVNALDSKIGNNFVLYGGDCVEIVKQLPSMSVDMCLFSPPFANVYTYSDSDRDMGNVRDEAEFITFYRMVARELYRVTRPGRVAVVHTKPIIRYTGAHGRAGWYDFPGDIIRAMEAEGWRYASEIAVWTDPVVEQRKTNNQRLLYCQLRKDSSYSGVGMPEKVLIFRRWATDEEESMISPVPHTVTEFPVELWQQWASPVWMDVRHTETLNVAAAREGGDEKHMCPLSLDLIRRALVLYSNPGDVVLSPFGGVGSEGVGALRLGRKYVGIELKPSYFRRAAQNLTAEESGAQVGLFG